MRRRFLSLGYNLSSKTDLLRDETCFFHRVSRGSEWSRSSRQSQRAPLQRQRRQLPDLQSLHPQSEKNPGYLRSVWLELVSPPLKKCHRVSRSSRTRSELSQTHLLHHRRLTFVSPSPISPLQKILEERGRVRSRKGKCHSPSQGIVRL